MNRNQWQFKLVWYVMVVLICAVFFFPLFWIGSAAFKTQSQIIASPPVWRFHPTLDNLRRVFEEQNFLAYLLHSTIIAVGATGLSLLLGVPAAYSISRFKQTSFGVVILIARLMPGISLLLPWYIVFSRLHLIDTYTALIASHILIALPLVVWIMINFFDGIPRAIEESAMVEGATRQGAFLHVLLPLTGPGIVTATTLSFVFSWNNFMFSLVLASRRTKTLPIAIYNFVSYAEVNWGDVMAAALVIIAPAIALTMIFQRYVVRGLTVGAVKG
jgi:multiple sugar transport system permease protein